MASIDWVGLFTSPDGRISRQHWWIGVVSVFLAGYVVDRLFGNEGLLMVLVGLVLLAAVIMVHIKRCHDRGKSGWWVLLTLIPIVGFIWAVIDLGMLAGDEGENAYGADPLQG